MSSDASERKLMDIREVEKILPHRPPFLLVDRILELRAGEMAVGLKAVTMNEEFFKGHFPGHPVMPAVLITEFLAQVGGVLMLSASGNEGKLAYFTGIDNQRFRKPVLPGDILVARVDLTAARGSMGKIHGECFVFRLETSRLDDSAGPAALSSPLETVPRNSLFGVSSGTGRDAGRDKKLTLGLLQGELAAEGDLMFALVEREAGDRES